MSWPVFIDLEEHVVPFDLDRKTPHPLRRFLGTKNKLEDDLDRRPGFRRANLGLAD